MWFLLLLVIGVTALSSFLLGPALLKIAQQVRDREDHLDDGSVVIVYAFVVGISLSVTIGLTSSLLTIIPLIITACLLPSTALELIKALRDRKELNKVSKGFLYAFFICFALTAVIALWTHCFYM